MVCTWVGEVRSARLKPNGRAEALFSNTDTSQACHKTRSRLKNNVFHRHLVAILLVTRVLQDLSSLSYKTSGYLVGEVVAIHLVAVGLTSGTLNINAMALQDGCFFKNTNLIIAYQLQENRNLHVRKPSDTHTVAEHHTRK